MALRFRACRHAWHAVGRRVRARVAARCGSAVRACRGGAAARACRDGKPVLGGLACLSRVRARKRPAACGALAAAARPTHARLRRAPCRAGPGPRCGALAPRAIRQGSDFASAWARLRSSTSSPGPRRRSRSSRCRCVARRGAPATRRGPPQRRQLVKTAATESEAPQPAARAYRRRAVCGCQRPGLAAAMQRRPGRS